MSLAGFSAAVYIRQLTTEQAFYIIAGQPWIAAQEVGVLLDRRKNSRLVLNLADDLHAQLARAASLRGQSGEMLATELLARGLEQDRQRQLAERALQALTPRERQVVALVVRGQTNQQIAEALVISSETVKTHIRHALQKFDQRSKIDLRLQLLRLGLSAAARCPSGSGDQKKPKRGAINQSGG